MRWARVEVRATRVSAATAARPADQWSFGSTSAKEVQVVGCWHQGPASPVQRLIDLGDAVTHPGMLRAKITSGPVVPGGIVHGVLAVGKAHGPNGSANK